MIETKFIFKTFELSCILRRFRTLPLCGLWSFFHGGSQFSNFLQTSTNSKSLVCLHRPVIQANGRLTIEDDLRSVMLHFNERQHPHWACRQYGQTGGTRRWLGVERWQLCLRDTSRSVKCHRRAAVGHWISLCVKCCRMVDSLPIRHTISIL